MERHLELLGLLVTDKVTGFTGVVTTISFELYGCVQAVVKPKMNGKGEIPDGSWFDVVRLEINSRTPVMQTPNFELGYVAEGKKGADVKPARSGKL